MNFYNPKEECGVFGIFNKENAFNFVLLGLHALQHRGQESAGIAVANSKISLHKGLGHVLKVFSDKALQSKLHGNTAIGHVRYSTSGDTILKNVQPLYAEYSLGGFALAHNGNLTNADEIKKQLIKEGSIFQSSSDSEVVLHLIARSKKSNIIDKIIDSLSKIEGAYSFVAVTQKKLIGIRDPLGVRPLCIGKLGDSWVLSSETTALNIINAEFVREVEPGEIVWFDKNGLNSRKPFNNAQPKFCIFEYIYFSRPDSTHNNLLVYNVRKEIGKQLAREHPINADLVIPIPDSGVPAAIGFSYELNIPFEIGIVRNHYIGRTFIEPSQDIRDLGVKLKHLPCKEIIKGKNVVLVDDSLVRGTTSKKIVNIVKDAGAKEVHLRISSPPTIGPCFYGIDTPTEEELIASKKSIENIRKYVGVSTLGFLSVDGLYRAILQEKRNNKNPQYCDACFTKDYAIKISKKI